MIKLTEKPFKKKKKAMKKPKSAKARLMKMKRKYYLKPEKAKQELEKSGLPGNVVSKKIGKQRLFFVSYKKSNLNIFRETKMIKLKHILTEKKELGGAIIDKIHDLTDKNAHNMARLTLAKAMRNKILMKNYEALMVLHTKFRDMNDLNSARNRLDKELFAQAKKMYSDYDIIHGAF